LRELLNDPAVIFLITVYICSVAILIYKERKEALSQFIFSGLCFALICLAFTLTEGLNISFYPAITDPWIGIASWVIIFAVFLERKFLFKPPKVRVREIDLFPLIWKSTILAVIPLIILLIKGDTFESIGLTPQNLWKNIEISFILTTLMVFPTLLYNPETWKPIRSGEISLKTLLAGFPVSFIVFFLSAGLPEEFFFRTFLQGHLTFVVGNETQALIVASLVFGWSHIQSMKEWYPNKTSVVLWARAQLIQTTLGIFFGVLWMRTKSLIPIVLTHTLVDSITNLTKTIQKLGWRSRTIAERQK